MKCKKIIDPRHRAGHITSERLKEVTVRPSLRKPCFEVVLFNHLKEKAWTLVLSVSQYSYLSIRIRSRIKPIVDPFDMQLESMLS